MIYVNKIENRITFKINTGYYLELLMHETLKLEVKEKKDENGDNVPHLEITEVVIVILSIVILATTIISIIRKSSIHLLIISRLVNY